MNADQADTLCSWVWMLSMGFSNVAEITRDLAGHVEMRNEWCLDESCSTKYWTSAMWHWRCPAKGK